MERKLTTILAADVVGYSKMMAANEESTLGILKERRSLIDGIINEHGGTIFGSAGDSVIAQFDSPVRATESAIQFQNMFKNTNTNLYNDAIRQTHCSQMYVNILKVKSAEFESIFKSVL